jgi:hypothetical protein
LLLDAFVRGLLIAGLLENDLPLSYGILDLLKEGLRL